jgi:natural product biosynthesis luciferase-like monooxygenase protein
MNLPSQNGHRPIEFGLFFFSSSEFISDSDRYRLLIESSKYADRHGFSSVWVPERHFTKEGGLFPNPAVLQAALARETERIGLRAGSVVMPLHDPVRVAEEWAVVDNLSGGRVGVSFASGWHPSDFVFFPERYSDRHEEMYRAIEVIRGLWRGESIERTGGDGKQVELRIYPAPVQAELPVWVTAAGSPQTFTRAGATGAHLLTHLFTQGYEELAQKIALYREALAGQGLDPASGRVTVAVPTFVSDGSEQINREVRRAFVNYVKAASYLINAFAHNRGRRIDIESLSAQELDEYVQWICERLIQQKSVLFGTPETCLEAVAELRAVGVDEIICQLDFGLETELVLENLPHLNRLRELALSMPPPVSVLPETLRQTEAAMQGLSSHAPPALLRGVTQPQARITKDSVAERKDPIAEIRARCVEEIAPAVFYDGLKSRGSQIAADLQVLERLWRHDGEALGRVRLLEAPEPEANAYRIHPALLNACRQLLIAALPANGGSQQLKTSYLLVSLRSLHVRSRLEREFWSHARLLADASPDKLEGDVRILDEEGGVILEACGLRMEPAERLVAGWSETPGPDGAEVSAQSCASVAASEEAAEANASSLRETFLSAAPAERERLLSLYLCERLGAVLEMPPERVDVDQGVNNLGLDSLMAIQLKNRIEKELAVAVPVTTFLRGGSVAQLTEQLLTQLVSPPALTALAATTEEETSEHPLSKGQRALWFMHQLAADGASYNTVELAVTVRGAIDVAALGRAFQALSDRHPSLRTIYTMRDANPVQVVLGAQPAHFELMDATGWTEAQLNERMVKEYQRPFNLERGPLLRASLFKRSDDEHVLLLAAHHIAVDFLSMEIIIEELRELYFADKAHVTAELRPLTRQYTDYVRWQAEMLAGPEGQRLRGYWREQLSGELPVLDLRTDRARPAGQSFRGAAHRFELDEELTARLRAFARAEAVTLNTTLLAVFFVLLHLYSDQEDILVGSPIAGRSRSEFEGLIGYFANPVMLRAKLAGDQTFKEFLHQVNTTALGALDHQDYPFSLLVEQLQIVRKPNRAPLSDVMFHLDRPIKKGGAIGAMIGQPGAGELLMEPFITTEQRVARYDLVLFMLEGEELVSAALQYKTELFDAATISRMAEHYRALLSAVVEQPDVRLSTLKRFASPDAARPQAADERPGTVPEQATFRRGKRRGVDLARVSLVKTGYLLPFEPSPLVIEPDAHDVDLAEWANSHRDFIEAKLLDAGALLFRGFHVTSARDFEQFAFACCAELFSDYGDLPREEVSGKVYGSTPYPAELTILFHNESSHLHRWPLKIWFYCAKAARRGGETPIVDCRKVYSLLPPAIRTRFEREGVMYVRNYTEGLDVSWQEFFRTGDRAALEDYCRRVGMEFQWHGDNSLRTRKVCPAVALHPKTGEAVFFNQIQAHHVSCLEPGVRQSLSTLFSEEELPRNVYYGNGAAIEDSVVAEIRDIYSRAAITFPWQEGDILMLDNMLIAHARNPFVGPRKIMVAMGEMISPEGEAGGEWK